MKYVVKNFNRVFFEMTCFGHGDNSDTYCSFKKYFYFENFNFFQAP